MNTNFIVVDNFYNNPDTIRNHALSTQYQNENLLTNWPGKDSEDQFVTSDCVTMISQIVNCPLTLSDMNKCGYYRITKENQKGTQHIHFDPNPGLIWAGVVYLTPTEKNHAGTKFWKHKKYGWDKAPSLQEASKYGIKNHDDMVNFFQTDGMDESKWEETFSVPFKYNRLVLFRPWLFHCGGAPFGNTDENSRLVQLFFFHSLA